MTLDRPTPWPVLDPAIEVDASAADVDALWDRFEIFEAMHHRQAICNPMTESELVEVLQALELEPSHRMLDVACGPGEVLMRAHEAGVVTSLGIDLSPWMLRAALGRARSRLEPGSGPRWLLADAAKLAPARFDTVVCLGADWIWRGMVGTVGALAERVEPGGRLAYGGPRLHFGADPAATAARFGALETAADVERRLADCGLRVRHRIDPDEAGWLAYLERGRRDVRAWAERHPGPRADGWIEEQAEWRARFENEREIVGWSVWVADRTG